MGFSAALARLAFDSIVQRDAPDANRGRAFAQFETRFQLGWVLAAFVPVVIPIPRMAGLRHRARVAAAFGMVSYVGRRPVPFAPAGPAAADGCRGRVVAGAADAGPRHDAGVGAVEPPTPPPDTACAPEP